MRRGEKGMGGEKRERKGEKLTFNEFKKKKNVLNNLLGTIFITSFNPYNNFARCTSLHFKDKEAHRL